MIDFKYYLSREWRIGEYECWAFVCDYYKRELGIDLPLINLGIDSSDAVNDAFNQADNVRVMFERVEKPEHNCIVEMGIKRITHVGVYLDTPDGPMVLHCRRKTGGLCQPIKEVQRTITLFSFNRLVTNAPNNLLAKPTQTL